MARQQRITELPVRETDTGLEAGTAGNVSEIQRELDLQNWGEVKSHIAKSRLKEVG